MRKILRMAGKYGSSSRQMENCMSLPIFLYCHFSSNLKFLNPFPNKPCFLRVCSKSLKNTVGKGEIARNEQFLLFPPCFLPIWSTFHNFYQT